MENTYPYVCEEPQTVQAFIDNKGGIHKTREDAIGASFENDFGTCCNQAIYSAQLQDTMGVLGFRKAVKQLANDYPDMLRVLMGDRDAT